MGYIHTNLKGTKYYLNSKEIEFKNGVKNTIFFFSKDMRRATHVDIPEGREVRETAKSGLPVLAKIK